MIHIDYTVIGAFLLGSAIFVFITMAYYKIKYRSWPRGLRADDIENLVLYHNLRYWDFNDPQLSADDYDKLVNHLKKVKPNSSVLKDFM